jgi:hypothetical protein
VAVVVGRVKRLPAPALVVQVVVAPVGGRRRQRWLVLPTPVVVVVVVETRIRVELLAGPA